MSSSNIQPVTVLSKTQWTDTLFSFKVTRPKSFNFTAGQFVRLGVNPNQLAYYQQSAVLNQCSNEHSDNNSPDNNNDNEEPIFRAYSIVSSPYDEYIEFFSIVIPNGAFTSQLKHLQVNDTLLLNTTPFGFLTLARYQKPVAKDLWLLSTGTGIAPFLSMLQDIDTWQNYQTIILVYSVRTKAELAYLDKINQLEENFGALVERPAKFIFIPIVTREDIQNTLNQRIPALLLNNKLQQAANYSLDVNSSHVMLCGNPDMVEETKETLKQLGLVMNRRGEGNIAVENYW